MAEGDSVFRLAGRLRPVLAGRTIVAGELRSGNAAGRRLDGAVVTEVDTHGKHLLMRFADGRTLHTHLRMSGSWRVTRGGLPASLRDDVRVRLGTDAGRTVWGLTLPVVDLVPTRSEADVIGHLGPDPLRDDWDAAQAVRRISAQPDRAVVAALLDQRLIAGLGNLWANELCFLRGLWPWRAVADVDVAGLVDTAARTLRISATVPGMYQTTTGRAVRGERHWVAGRAGRPCLRCGTTVRVRAETPGDPERRRTWWCPQCQPGGATG